MKQEPTQNNPNQWGKSGADIVERLRSSHPYTPTEIELEAADEIERLGSDLLACRDEYAMFRVEIERLREALENIREQTELDDQPIGAFDRFIVSIHEIALAALSQKEGE